MCSKRSKSKADIPIAIDDEAKAVLGAQYYPQRSVGGAQIGSFSTYGYGLTAGAWHGAFGAQFYYTQTGRRLTSPDPYGDHPSYLNLRQIIFDTAGEKAWGIRGTVDFNKLGVPVLTAYAFYAAGQDRINSSTGAPLPNHNETDVRADYAFAKGTLLEGLVATFRYFVAPSGRRAADANRPARDPQLLRAFLTAS